MVRWLLALLFLLAPIPSAFAKTITIQYDGGGEIASYDKRFSQYQNSGTQVVIDGSCMSACTRFMRLQNICSTPRGYFFFHGVTVNERIRPDLSMEDSLQTDTPEAYALEKKYGTFSYGLVMKRPAPKVYLEAGVERVYTSIWANAPTAGPFQVWLKVKATKLVPPCK